MLGEIFWEVRQQSKIADAQLQATKADNQSRTIKSLYPAA